MCVGGGGCLCPADHAEVCIIADVPLTNTQERLRCGVCASWTSACVGASVRCVCGVCVRPVCGMCAVCVCACVRCVCPVFSQPLIKTEIAVQNKT